MRATRYALLLASAALTLAACGGTADRETHRAAATATAPADAKKAVASSPLRDGERFLDIAMPKAYTPKAPSAGTDDYRCFLLDPKLTKSAFVTGTDVIPGRPKLVHHVILFQLPPDEIAKAKSKDAATPGEGWTCFGGTGISSDPGAVIESAPWLAAWAPGGGEQLLAPDLGVPLKAGSRIVMQVHYNLLAGKGSDTSSARLRLAPGTAKLTELHTMLMPAPVELPCRPGKTGRLCKRDAAVFDVIGRFGPEAGPTIAGLQLLCGKDPQHPKASPVQTCDRTIRKPVTVRAIAGHMHLLGRSISIDLNPGKPGSRRLLDIPVWDFD
ncbi:MAG: hypothetical protein ABIR57_07355, partial [Aeromicrobium sp.]